MHLNWFQLIFIFALGVIAGMAYILLRLYTWEKKDKYGYFYKSQGGLLDDTNSEDSSK